MLWLLSLPSTMAPGHCARVETKALSVWSLPLAAAVPSPMLLELGLDFPQDGTVCLVVEVMERSCLWDGSGPMAESCWNFTPMGTFPRGVPRHRKSKINFD